jgi:hypothetical protein
MTLANPPHKTSVLRFTALRADERFATSPEQCCSEIFQAYAKRFLTDSTAADWGVEAYLVPVIAHTIAACGREVVDRMYRLG